MRRTLTLAAVLLIAIAPAAVANDEGTAAEVKKIVQALGEQTVAAVKIENADERRRQLREAATPAMDFNVIGAGVLAYAGANVPPNREAEVLDEVIDYIARNITAELERIRPETATVGAVEIKSEREARVSMALAGARNAIDAQWLFRKIGERWRIIDVEVSGNLLTAHYGEKLSRYARGVDQLVQYLRDQHKRKGNQTALRP
jgi:ABC-type transporter MlaC component